MSKTCHFRTVSVRNRLDKKITNVSVKYGQSDKNTGIIGYLGDLGTVDIETGDYIMHAETVKFDDIEPHQEKTVQHDIMFYTAKRGYWQVYFDYDGKSYKINKNNAQVNPWEIDDEKYVEVALRPEGEYIRIEFNMDSGHAYFYAAEAAAVAAAAAASIATTTTTTEAVF